MNENKRKSIVIIDGHAIIHRAYHALPPMTTKDGTIVNAVFGFTSMLLKVLHDMHPTHIAVSFDVAGGTFRDAIYEEYKATRVEADQDLYDQIPLVYDVVEAFNIPIYKKEGYEADDVIGTLVQKIKEGHTDADTTIITGDKDMLQLVDDAGHVQVALLGRGMSDFSLFDEAAVQKKFGFGPEHIVDYKALMGDPSDNIPGVKGVGDKTATELIQLVGGIDEIYAALDTLQQKGIKPSVVEKLRVDKKNAYMSAELATIMRTVKGITVKLPALETQDFDRSTVRSLLQRLEFFSLIKRVPGLDQEAEKSTKKKHPTKAPMAEYITTAAFDQWIAKRKKEKQFVVKEYWSGLLPGGTLEKILIGHDGNFSLCEKKALGEDQWNALLILLCQPDVLLVGHDLKGLIKALMAEGEACDAQLFDIMIASYIVNASTRAHDLRSIVIRELQIDLPEGGVQGDLFADTDTAVPLPYTYCQQLYTHFLNALVEEKQDALFNDIEMALIPVLAQMEMSGIQLDPSVLQTMSTQVHARLEALTQEIHALAGKAFNIASSQQLREVLFETLGLSVQGIKKGKTGLSTAASELEKMRESHPIIVLIEEHRELSKLQNTYIDVLPTLVNPSTGRIHTSFNQAVAQTGRLSSSDPNLQNIPVRTELGQKIRDAFVAKPGCVLVSADYSQIELRVVASLAKDAQLMAIFARGGDIHRETAAVIHGVTPEDVTPAMRSAAKAVNFGVLYGMGAYGLSWRTQISQQDAKAFIEAYFKAFSGVKKFLDATLKQARDRGYVETIMGRRRHIPELASTNYQLRASGERMAINMPVQGTAAEIMKLAMIEVSDAFAATYGEDAKILLQVHDELVVEVKKEIADAVAQQMKDRMEQVIELAVPVEVHVHIGTHWGELK